MSKFFSNLFSAVAVCYRKSVVTLKKKFAEAASFFKRVNRAVEPLPLSETQVDTTEVPAGFRIQSEMREGGNTCEFAVSEVVTDVAIVSFDSRSSQLERQTPLVRELLQLRGVKQVWLQPYEVTVKWSEVFSSQEMVPRIKGIITKHLSV